MDKINTTNKNNTFAKVFIFVFIASLIAFIITITALIPKYNEYEKAQKFITTSLLIYDDYDDKFDIYKDNDKLLAIKMYNYYYCAIDTDGSRMDRALVPFLNKVVNEIDDLFRQSDFDEFYDSYDYMKCYSYLDYCIYAHKAIFIVEIIVTVSSMGFFVFFKKEGEEYGREKNN